MRTRLLAFFIALVLSLPGVLSLGLSEANAASPAAVQEVEVAAEAGPSTSALDLLSGEFPSPAHGEVALDVPELLNAHNAPASFAEAVSRLRPLSVAAAMPPFLEGPQRPPRALSQLA